MATAPPTFEASFLRAMQLLHSPDKSATDQLKSMLDECQAQKKAIPTTSASAVTTNSKPLPPSSIKPVILNKSAPVAPVPTPILVPTDDIDKTSFSCIVCKRADFTAGNEIVECQECHSLYHQECHKPSLTNEDVKDPRFVWYCSTCTNKRKKVKLPNKPPTLAAGNGSTNKETKDQQNPELSPFKSWSFIKK